MADATVAEEEYLQTIFWLQEAGLPMTGANVARAMQLSAPTVHEMVGRLERDGYITRAKDKSISFTESGREEAEEIVSRHRLIERFLTRLGIAGSKEFPGCRKYRCQRTKRHRRKKDRVAPFVEEALLIAVVVLKCSRMDRKIGAGIGALIGAGVGLGAALIKRLTSDE